MSSRGKAAPLTEEERAARKAAEDAATEHFLASQKAKREADNAPTINPVNAYAETLRDTKLELAEQAADMDRRLKVIAIIPILLNMSRSSFASHSLQLENPAIQERLNVLAEAYQAYKELKAGVENNVSNSNNDYPAGVGHDYLRLTHPNYKSSNNNNANSNNSNTTAFTKKASMARRRMASLYHKINKLTDNKNYKLIHDTIKVIIERNKEDELEDIVMAPEFAQIIRIIEQPVAIYKLWKQHFLEERESSRGIRAATTAKEVAAKAARNAKEADKIAKMRQLFERYYVGGEGAGEFYGDLDIVNDFSHMSSVYITPVKDEIDRAMRSGNAFTELAEILAIEMQKVESGIKPKQLDRYDLEYLTDKVDRRRRDLYVIDQLLGKRVAENAKSGSGAASIEVIRLTKMREMLIELITLMMTEINKGNPRTYNNSNFRFDRGGAGSKGGRRRATLKVHRNSKV